MLKNICKINFKLQPKNLNLITLPFESFGVYRGNRELSKEYEKEKGDYNRAKKVMLKQHTQDFWEEQTRVENEWVENFLKIQKDKKFRDDAKLRNTIIKNSFQCYQNIQQEIQNQQEFLAKQKLWREEDTQVLMEKHSILTMLDRQAEEDWLTPDNVDAKLSQQMNQILPPTILSHVDYYKKLNTYALLMEQGYTKEAEDLKMNKKIIDYKNKQLQPIYEELKTIIRHFTYSEEHSVHALYKETILRIDNYLVTQETKNDFNQLKDNLNYLFKRLITLIRTENEKADNKLELIENQLKNLTMILVIWNKYTDIIYIPDAEIEKILYRKKEEEEGNQSDERIASKPLEDLVEEKNPSLLKEYYFSKITEKKSKGCGLFVQDFRGFYDDVGIRRTVDEKMGLSKDTDAELKKLSDLTPSNEVYTTESDEDEGVLKENEEEVSEEASDNKEKKGKKLLGATLTGANKKTEKKIKERKSITGEKRKLIETEVSEVFEENGEFEYEGTIDGSSKKTNSITTGTGANKASNKLENISDPLEPESNQYEGAQKNALKKLKKEKKLLEEFMLMQIKNSAAKSKVSNLDVNYEFKKYKENLVKELGLKDEKDLHADIDKELEEVDLSKVIDINEFEAEILKEQERITIEKEFKDFKTEDLFKSELFNTILKYSKDIFDFNKPKISTNLDIYDENLIRFLEYSVQESYLIHKSSSTSLIMEFIKEELKRINDDTLNPTNKLKKKHLIRVADVCGRMRVPDSQNLKQVFDMFKHSAVKFE